MHSRWPLQESVRPVGMRRLGQVCAGHSREPRWPSGPWSGTQWGGGGQGELPELSLLQETLAPRTERLWPCAVTETHSLP